ncbi:MAG TPA: hypothetical protein VK427_15980 [Kofleriaceae bacterium]|nr:hypothetical protein [Kofleriaceae bacterium]
MPPRDPEQQQKPQSTQTKEPTAGPSADDRFGAVENDVEARIAGKQEQEGKPTRIMIAKGSTHGVANGMTGYVKAGRGALASFAVYGVAPTVSYADVRLSEEQLEGHQLVVLNPSKMPEVQIDGPRKVRLLAARQKGEYVEIVIGNGAKQGMRPSQPGYVAYDSGRRGAIFNVAHVNDTTSVALIAASMDEVEGVRYVMIEPHADAASPPDAAPAAETKQAAGAKAAATPAARATMRGRLLGASVVAHNTHLEISGGKNAGMEVGMVGYLEQDNGVRSASVFVIAVQENRATVVASLPVEQARTFKSVVLEPKDGE